MEAAIVFISMFIVIFGISYLYFSTRHKERLALIEKDKDVSIFYSKRTSKTPPIWKIIILNLSLILIGVGLGILMGNLLTRMGLDDQTSYPASIFLMSGAGLLIGYFLTRKIED